METNHEIELIITAVLGRSNVSSIKMLVVTINAMSMRINTCMNTLIQNELIKRSALFVLDPKVGVRN